MTRLRTLLQNRGSRARTGRDYHRDRGLPQNMGAEWEVA
jgi:hypothetical protein